MNADAENARLVRLCEVLEEEIRRLFEDAGRTALAGRPPGDHQTPAERLAWLEQAFDRLSEPNAAPVTALCLSGGGIRSATFSLGVVQGLAQRNVLKDCHYLSTVSGGGYFGGCLSTWIQREGFDAVMRELKSTSGLAKDKAAPDPRPIRRLRAYTNYLSPVWGMSLDGLTLAATFVRNLSLHWSVLLPLLCAALLLPRLQVAMQLLRVPDAVPGCAFWLALACVFVSVAYTASDLPGEADCPSKPPPSNRFEGWGMFPLFLAALLMSWCGVWANANGSWPQIEPWTTLAEPSWRSVLYFALGGAALHLLAAGAGAFVRTFRNLKSRRYTYPIRAGVAAAVTGAVGGALLFLYFLVVKPGPQQASAGQPPNLDISDVLMHGHHLHAVLAVPALLLIFWIAVTFFVGAMSRLTSEEDREWWSRASAVSLAWSLGWLAVSLVVLCLPFWILQAPGLRGQDDAKTIIGAGTGVLGAVISAWGYWSKRGPVIRERVETLSARLGVRMFDIVSFIFILLLAVVVSFSTSWAVEKLSTHTLNDWVTKIGKSTGVWSPATMAQGLGAMPGDIDQALQDWQSQEWTRLDKNARCTGKAIEPCAIDALIDVNEPPPAARFAIVLTHSSLLLLLALLAALLVFGLSTMKLVGVNTFSLHAMYGNRLVRAYLGATRAKRFPHWFTGFDPFDNMPLAALDIASKRLYPVLNVALNLAQAAGDRLEWQQRKAASFFLTPDACGSPALGFVPTHEYGRKPMNESERLKSAEWRKEQDPGVDHTLGGLTLGRAVAISGAAASPNMGYHTSPLVAFAMSFFNVRLGWWMPNPQAEFKPSWCKEEPSWGLVNVIAEATAGTSADHPFVYLSDGGHFENLGLYEMVRRRCRRIVLVDATADGSYHYADLESSIRKIRIDLGAEVSFPGGLPTAESVRRTKRHFAVGKIQFRNSSQPGSVIYIKPALSDDVPLDVRRYAASQKRKDAAFPHDPTSHQNFDEAQFESYRMLGLFSALNAFKWDDWSVDEPDHGPLPTPKDGDDTPGTPPAAGGGGGLRNLAAGALLGSLAVTGTVALKDNQVVLKNTELTLRPATVQLVSEPLRLDPALTDSLRALILALATTKDTTTTTLIAAFDRLERILVLNHQDPRVEALRIEIVAIRAQLAAMRPQQINIELGKDIQEDIRRIAVALSSPARAASQPSSGGPAQALPAPIAAPLVEALQQIRRAVEGNAPRRNVSGTAEGARP